MNRLELVWPMSQILTSNQRLHWAPKAQHTKDLRWASFLLATNYANHGQFDRAHIVVTVTWPDKRRRDVHNLMPTIKACIDGFVDAGLIPDDSDQHLVGPDLRVSDGPGVKGHVALSFQITQVDGEPA